MKKFKGIVGAPASEFSEEFVQGMADRMAVSFHKYGAVADAYPSKVDAIASLHKRLEKYAEDGNTEWLIDVGNFAMIEYMRPRHKKAHFRATDSQESPGRKFTKQKGFSAAANLESKQTENDALSTYKGRQGD